MLISDWSSDVCSSDLITLPCELDLEIAVVAVAKRGDRARQVKAPHAIEARVVDCLDLLARGDGAVVPGLQRIGIMEPQHLDIGRPQAIVLHMRHDLGPRRRIAAREDVLAGRSEEHTSELQSL